MIYDNEEFKLSNIQAVYTILYCTILYYLVFTQCNQQLYSNCE